MLRRDVLPHRAIVLRHDVVVTLFISVMTSFASWSLPDPALEQHQSPEHQLWAAACRLSCEGDEACAGIQLSGPPGAVWTVELCSGYRACEELAAGFEPGAGAF